MVETMRADLGRMLYDFYQQQVGRKPGCIHATYLLCGVRRSPQVPAVQITQAKDDEDEAMQSSPFMRSSADGEEVTETIPVRSVVLVREDELRGELNVNEGEGGN